MMFSEQPSEIFAEINYHIQPLLISIEQELQLRSSGEEPSLHVLKCQHEHARNLKEKISHMLEANSENVEFQAAILTMEEYILLPLTLILRKKQKHETSNQKSERNSNSSECLPSTPSSTSDFMKRSAEYSCIMEAAQIMNIFIRYTCNINTDADRAQIIISCLTSCAIATQFLQNQSSTEVNALDHGDECLKTLLKTIHELFRLCSRGLNSPNNILKPSPLQDQIISALNGTLIAQLTQTCLSTLLLEHKKTPQSTKKLVKHHHSKENFGLQMQALESLSTIMKSTPVPDLWRKLFPGTFSVSFTNISLLHADAEVHSCSNYFLSFTRVFSVSLYLHCNYPSHLQDWVKKSSL